MPPDVSGQFRALMDEANRAQQQGFYPAARERLLSAHKLAPRHTAPLYALAMAEIAMEQHRSARSRIQQAFRLATAKPPASWHNALALTHLGEADAAKAEEAIARGLKDHPDDPLLMLCLAEICRKDNRRDEAARILTPLTELGGPRGAEAVLALANLRRRGGVAQEMLPRVDRVLGDEALSPEMRRRLLFARGDLLDAAGRYDDAFESYAQANALSPHSFDPDRFDDAIARMLGAWSAGAIAALPESRARGERVVLIVGMPRSGTSLVEQIIASHPQAYGCGERTDLPNIARGINGDIREPFDLITDLSGLTEPALTRAGAEYAGALTKAGKRARIVTDKAPMNWLHVGLVSAMLPGVRVVWCRRDPRDTCLSCYFQDFNRVPFASALSHLARVHRASERAHKHWSTALATNMLEIEYERLVDDQEAQSRAIIGFIGLDWDDACLAFHTTRRMTLTASNDQVTQPMYSSSKARWRHYERHLGPLAGLA